MKIKLINKKSIGIISKCFLVFVVLCALYLLVILPKLNGENFTGLVLENAHTGLFKPAMRIAFDDQNNKERLAKIENPTKTEAQNKEVALESNLPTVLFDVSVQPIFERDNRAFLFLWLSILGTLLLFFAIFIRKTIKKAKIKKIKEN